MKIEHESKITYQEERIKSLQMECEQKNRAFTMVEGKYLKTLETIEDKILLIKEKEQ